MTPPVQRRRRFWKIFLLFLRMLRSFFTAYARARLAGRPYDFYDDRTRNRARARWIRETAVEMGGVMIKIGQFLSTRVDLLPDEYIEELSSLQDEVPPVTFEQIRAVVEDAFAQPLGTVFAAFDPSPLAAASLGQAHRATMWGGEQVVVKVQRPRIDAIVEADLSSIDFVVSWLNRWRAVRRRVDLPGILAEFRVTLRAELDYVAEAHNAERLAVSFFDRPDVRIPQVYWSHVRPKVLTLQYTPGIKINDYARIEDAGISRSQLAELILQAYLKQVLVDGFFHADPHPGNVFARPGPTVVFVDFGMVGQLTPQMRDNLRRIFVGIVRRDFDSVVLAMVRLGFVRPQADLNVVKRALIWAVDNFYGLSFGELRDVDAREVLRYVEDLLRTEAFQIPTNFAFLSRALGTLSGLCTGLDPSFQFVTVAEPFGRQLIAEDSRWGLLGRAGAEARALGMTALALPHLTRSVLARVDQGELDVKRDLQEMTAAFERMHRTFRKLYYGVLASAFLVSAALLVPSHSAALTIVLVAVAVLLLLRLITLTFTGRR